MSGLGVPLDGWPEHVVGTSARPLGYRRYRIEHFIDAVCQTSLRAPDAETARRILDHDVREGIRPHDDEVVEVRLVVSSIDLEPITATLDRAWAQVLAREAPAVDPDEVFIGGEEVHEMAREVHAFREALSDASPADIVGAPGTVAPAPAAPADPEFNAVFHARQHETAYVWARDADHAIAMLEADIDARCGPDSLDRPEDRRTRIECVIAGLVPKPKPKAKPKPTARRSATERGDERP